MQLDGKVAFVTGAGSGIGKGAAVLLAKEGAKVVCLADTDKEITETVVEITSAGGQAIAIVADVSQADAVEQAVKKTVAQFERLDIVFANAGINGVWSPIEELQPEEWDKSINIDLRGTYLTIHFAVPHLKKQGGGSIIVTSSVNGNRMFSNSGATAYSVAKAGQVAMVQMLAVELGPSNIRVNAVCPGAIDTEINDNSKHRDLDKIGVKVEFPNGKIPLGGKPGTSEEVAQLVLFLASDAARHISGTPIYIDGAESLLKG